MIAIWIALTGVILIPQMYSALAKAFYSFGTVVFTIYFMYKSIWLAFTKEEETWKK